MMMTLKTKYVYVTSMASITKRVELVLLIAVYTSYMVTMGDLRW